MSVNSLFHPVPFYLVTMLVALGICPLAVYLGRLQLEKYQILLALLSLCIPCITALFMIFASHNSILIDDFIARLLLFKIRPMYLMIILFIMPSVVCLATCGSLFLGYSSDQFLVSKELSVLKGWSIFGIIFPLILAPLIEEIGWRGYGVDSLRAYFNLFTTCALFGLLWSVWHLPMFFVKGSYHNELLDLGAVYVVNFFLSTIVFAFLMNWVYYKTDRSIPALVLFHSLSNLSMMLLRTNPFTKCLVTVGLCLISLFLIIFDRDFFFVTSALPMLKR